MVFEGVFEVVFLVGGQGVIEDDQIGFGGFDLVVQFFDFVVVDQEFGSQVIVGDVEESDYVGIC